MGARLQYAKVIDRELYYARGGRVHPGLDNEVLVQEAPGTAGAFLVMRAWNDDHGSFTEQWRIEAPGGAVVYENSPREIYLPTNGHVERVEDEVADLNFEYEAEDYNVVFVLDDMEVARATFPVRVREEGMRFT